MSEQAPLKTLRITSSGVGGSVHLNGVDVSSALFGVNLSVGAGNTPHAYLDLNVHDLSAEVEATVLLPDETKELLVRLGWTPPAEEASS